MTTRYSTHALSFKTFPVVGAGTIWLVLANVLFADMTCVSSGLDQFRTHVLFHISLPLQPIWRSRIAATVGAGYMRVTQHVSDFMEWEVNLMRVKPWDLGVFLCRATILIQTWGYRQLFFTKKLKSLIRVLCIYFE